LVLVGTVVELALRAGPPGVTVVSVDVGTTEVETVVEVETLTLEEDEEEEEMYVVVVDSPEEITDVVVVVTVGRGQVGRTMVEVKPSVITTVVDWAEAALRRAARAMRDLKLGILPT
jgi:hypothetical protein